MAETVVAGTVVAELAGFKRKRSPSPDGREPKCHRPLESLEQIPKRPLPTDEAGWNAELAIVFQPRQASDEELQASAAPGHECKNVIPDGTPLKKIMCAFCEDSDSGSDSDDPDEYVCRGCAFKDGAVLMNFWPDDTEANLLFIGMDYWLEEYLICADCLKADIHPMWIILRQTMDHIANKTESLVVSAKTRDDKTYAENILEHLSTHPNDVVLFYKQLDADPSKMFTSKPVESDAE